ncbi:hypothetical protein F0253_24835 [Vibrio coralliilyticus]|nr:hypothetical protein [Vibrio coralliilyticus]
MPQQYRYLCMILGLFVAFFFAYASYTHVYMDFINGTRDQVDEIRVSYGDGVLIGVTFFLFTYIVPFLYLNRHRKRQPLELWEMYSAKSMSIATMGALGVTLLIGFVYKKIEVNHLSSSGYEYSHTKENHRALGFDTDIYVLTE